MAEDRPYRASEPPVRGPAKTSASDPLAELARLIGQTDPFGEFGRDRAGRAPAPQPLEHRDWNSQPARPSYAEQPRVDPRQTMAEPDGYAGQNYARQPYGGGGAPTAPADDFYQAEHDARGYPQSQVDYQQDPYEHDKAQLAEEEYYEDAPPSRRRLGVLAIAGVFALAVIGTAGAFGYRALFSSPASSQPPPVIKADAGPSKIVPPAAGRDAQSSKLITDRMNERGQSEKLVSREEQPIDKPTTVVLAQNPPQSALGSGVVGSEPKKVRTIAIHPDQSVVADATSGGASPLAAAPSARAAQAPAAPPPARAAAAVARSANDNAAADEPDQRSAPVRQAAPLSLNPNSAPARPSAPTRTAAVAPQEAAPAPTTSAAAGAGSFVQVSSQRSDAEAQAAFRSLQAKYPTQLGGRQAQIHKVDLGAKGTYYRAMVGPFGNANEAGELCSSLKAAGGQCLIQRN